MPLQKAHGGVGSRSRPCGRQLEHLRTLYPQRFADRRTRSPQLRAVGVQRVQVESLFAVVPVADLGGT
ncbi:hypothetical protein A4G29_18055 [Mycobacterium kansasii]|nr:hypothetical protein A4G29_18055 [Mycobacterium kansasii]